MSTARINVHLANPARIGALLRAARELRGESLPALAHRMSMRSTGHLARVECGHVSMRIETLAAICSALDITIADLFTEGRS